MRHLIVLDNEAVQALGDTGHRQHRRVVAHAQVAAHRKARAGQVYVVVPTAVRVEAGWDRTAPTWAFANHLRVADVPLDGAHTNAAAAIRHRTGVSVADAHLGAAIASAPADRVTVLTSDPDDVRLVAGDRAIVVVRI